MLCGNVKFNLGVCVNKFSLISRLNYNLNVTFILILVDLYHENNKTAYVTVNVNPCVKHN